MFENKKCFLFDIDGTLAVGDTLYAGTAPLLEYIASIGGSSFFITNNSTKSGEDYVKKFKKEFHLNTKPEQFITSGYMTQKMLLENYKDKPIYCLGTKSYIEDLRNSGLCVYEEDRDDYQCIVVAYDSEVNYEKLSLASKLLQTLDVPFYGTNPDLRCPIDFGFIPDCGAICNLLTETTDKKPIYLGKPNPEVVDICLKLSGFEKHEALVVGDRLYTDIACGINANVDTCVVLTGEATQKDLLTTPYQPTTCFQTIQDLYKSIAH